ncbi:MAG: WD40 repeat domain-containing serine/threonine-protein kinase [Microcoleus sp.]
MSRLLSDDSGFGNIYEVFQGFSAKILKVLKPEWNNQPKAIELFKREYEVLKELSQQGVRGIPQAESYFEYTTKPGLKLYCLVMEKVEGVDLIQSLNNNGKVNQTQALKWLREIVLILDKIHQKKYFHRDIKPPNIMMRNNGELVLIDFGTAREETQTYYQKVQGGQVTGISSVGYTPIEQQHGQAVAPSDFFALGRTFVHLLTGKHPLDMYDPMRDVLNWRGYTKNINPLLLDLIDDLMARLAADRPQNTQVILQRLERIEQNLKQPQNPVPHPVPISPPQFPKKQIRNSLIVVGSITLLGLGIVSLRQPSSVVTTNQPTETPTPINTPRLTPIPKTTPTPIETPTPETIVTTNQPTETPTPINTPRLTPIPETTPTPIETPTPETIPIQLIKYTKISLAQTFSDHSYAVKSVVFSPDGKVLASVRSDSTIKLWEMKTGREINSLSGHHNSAGFAAFSPDGKVLASGGDRKIKLWEVATGREINSLSGHSNWVNSVAFSPDGQVLASGGDGETIKLREVKTGRKINFLSGHSGSVWSVAFSPDGKVLASGGDRKIKLWEVATGREINSLTGHSNWVRSVAFSPDGQVLASGSWDETIKLWEVKTGRLINTLSGHSGWVESVAFSPDGQVLASGGVDDTIKLWEVKTGREINTLSGHSHSVNSVAFSPDGQVLASGSKDGTIKLWRVGN